MTSAGKLSTGPSRTRARGLDVDGNINIPGNSLRPRAYACTWREACKAADYVLEHFGNPLRDRGIWVWYCQRLGLNQFLDLADEVISSARQGEVKSPQTTQTHCRRRIHLPKAIAKRRYGGAQNISAQPASARLRQLATLGAYLLAPPLRRRLK